MEVKMGHLVKGQCPVCGADIWSDDDEPYYVETKEGKVYLCSVCGPGLAKILSMLGISVVIDEVEIGELPKRELARK
ncbi:hypothetical protein ES703_121690 [subsurface metagenome]